MYLGVANRPHLLGAGVHLYHRDSPWKIRCAWSNRAPAEMFQSAIHLLLERPKGVNNRLTALRGRMMIVRALPETRNETASLASLPG
jgi:hypothetical protein